MIHPNLAKSGADLEKPIVSVVGVSVVPLAARRNNNSLPCQEDGRVVIDAIFIVAAVVEQGQLTVSGNPHFVVPLKNYHSPL